MFAKPTLVVYSFAPKRTRYSPQLAEGAHQYLRKLWTACDHLGISSAITDSDEDQNTSDPLAASEASEDGVPPRESFPTQFPESFSSNPAFRIAAAKTAPTRAADYQAFIFEYQDAVGFVVTLEAPAEDASLTPWSQLLEEWKGVVGDCQMPAGLMQEVYLFFALKDENTLATSLPEAAQAAKAISDLSRQVVDALPRRGKLVAGSGIPFVAADGCHIWEGEELLSRRTIGIIAPREKEDQFFRWAVWPETPHLASLPRYLLHAAKIRFAESVFEFELPKIETTAQLLDKELRRMLPLYRKLQNLPVWDVDQIKKAYEDLIDEQTRSSDLLFDITRLKELLLTTQIALKNTQSYIPVRNAGFGAGGIFEEDRKRGVRLRDQIRIELGYLGALRERVQAGHRTVRLHLEQRSERTAHRLGSLGLFHVTLLGSLTTGLLMLPAFEVFDHSRNLVWALTVFLMATALAVPPLFARWHETYKWVDAFLVGGFCAALSFFIITIWEELHLPARHVSRTSHILFKVVVSVIAFLVGVFLLRWIGRKKPAAKNA